MERFYLRYPRLGHRVVLTLGMLMVCCAIQGQGAFAAAPLDSPTDVAQFVYQKLPNLPLENHYIRVDTKKQAKNSTLVSRLIQYHTSIKGRSPLYRLDWKITLADYLGVNDYLQVEKYPGNGFLKSNPMERDRQLIQALTLTQRNALIQALVNGFSGQSETIAPQSNQNSAPKTEESSKPKPPSPSLPSRSSTDLTQPSNPAGSRSEGEARFLMP